jgi:hypothetical protein
MSVVGASLFLLNSTASENSASRYGGGLDSDTSNYFNMANSIVSGNRAGLAGAEISDYENDTAFVVDNVNLFGSASKSNNSAFLNFSPGNRDINATHDGISTPARGILTPLANNGGPTLPHGLAELSPAIGVGINTDCGTGKTIVIDQRGELRNDGLFDLGAFEGFLDGTAYNISSFIV